MRPIVDRMRDGEALIAAIRWHCLRLDWVPETRIHADHITEASALPSTLGGRHAIGAGARPALGVQAGGFVAVRTGRDRSLSPPPVRANLCAGWVP